MTEEIQQLVQTAIIGAGLGGGGGIARAIIFGAGGLGVLTSIIVSGGVLGCLVFLVLQGDHPTLGIIASPAARISVTVIAAFFALELFRGARVLANQFSTDPIGLVRSIWQGLRGK